MYLEIKDGKKLSYFLIILSFSVWNVFQISHFLARNGSIDSKHFQKSFSEKLEKLSETVGFPSTKTAALLLCTS